MVLDKAQWFAVSIRGPQHGLAALAACLVVVACGPTIDGRPIGTAPIGLASNTTPGDGGSSLFDCEQIQVPAQLGFVPPYDGYSPIYWRAFEDTQFGDEVLPDTFSVFIATDKAGAYDLGSGDNVSWSSCQQCLRIDLDNGSRVYFQESGTLEIDPGSSPTKGRLESDLVNVRLIEVEIDDETGATTRVEGGDCFEIEDIEITSLVVEDWTCATAFYGSGDGCDCGCGVTDPDCRNEGVNACKWCGNPGSCGGVGNDCPGAIHPDDNAVCDVTKAWTCDLALYDSGGDCDCGCGLFDPDCKNSKATACDTCTAAGSCADPATTDCIGAIHAVNNAVCTPFPGWTCDPTFYGSNDGCDCGCNIKDPDCSGGNACDFCNEIGSCAEGEMNCNSIDPNDTGLCR